MKAGIALLMAIVVSGCAHTTMIQSTTPDGAVSIRKSEQTSTPRTVEMSDTSFANYDFKATGKDKKVFYGYLPMQIHVGRIIVDTLLFAPGLFFNIRSVYPHYEFDADNNVLKYRRRDTDLWREYRPTEDESNRAKLYFEKQ